MTSTRAATPVTATKLANLFLLLRSNSGLYCVDRQHAVILFVGNYNQKRSTRDPKFLIRVLVLSFQVFVVLDRLGNEMQRPFFLLGICSDITQKFYIYPSYSRLQCIRIYFCS